MNFKMEQEPTQSSLGARVQIKLEELLRADHMVLHDKRQQTQKNVNSVALSSQTLSEGSSDGPSSMMTGSNDSVDISGQFQAMKDQLKEVLYSLVDGDPDQLKQMQQPFQLEEVKEAMSPKDEESASKVQEDEAEIQFFEELPEDMVDEGVSATNMSGFNLKK